MKPLITLAALLVLSACGARTHTGSGADYVGRADGARPIDAEIAQIAAVEPHLQFPARIGVARMEWNNVSIPGPAEAELLSEFGKRHAAMGEFVPITPMAANLVPRPDEDCCLPAPQKVRRLAARLHLDYVILYKLDGDGLRRNSLRGLASAEAAFMDVRTGYIYATSSVSVDLKVGRARFLSEHRDLPRQERAEYRVVSALLDEVDPTMIRIAAMGGAQ